MARILCGGERVSGVERHVAAKMAGSKWREIGLVSRRDIETQIHTIKSKIQTMAKNEPGSRSRTERVERPITHIIDIDLIDSSIRLLHPSD